jgi:AcrR family transcriptional regulator
MASDTRGNETKAALLDAAKRLIAERGYAGASVRELAAAAGVNIGAVNYHFGSRENLLTEAILEYYEEWGDQVDAVEVDPEAEPLVALGARMRPILDGIAAAQPYFVVALESILQAQRSPELKRRVVEHYAKQRRHAAESMAEQGSELAKQLPLRFREVIASYMIAVADGLQLQGLLDPDAIPTSDELAFMYEAFAAAARAAVPPAASPQGKMS